MLHILGKYMTNVLMYSPRTKVQKKGNMIGVFLTVLHPTFPTFIFSYLYFYACHFKFLLFFFSK